MSIRRVDTKPLRDRETDRALDDNPLLNGRLVAVQLGARASFTLKHGLGRPYRGFVCTSGEFGFQEDASNSDKGNTLAITVNGGGSGSNPATVHIWVF